MEKHWKCNQCGQEEGVVNGVCPKCGPAQTTPLTKDALVEAGADEESKAAAQKALAEEAKNADEAEKRNAESIAASEGKSIDPTTLLPSEDVEEEE